MIPVSKTPAIAPGTATPLPTGTPETPTSTFDAILSLESLAAGSMALDAGAIDGGALEELDEAFGDDRDERDADETEGEAEGPLAFIVSLLNMATVPAQPPSATHAETASDLAIEDALDGPGGNGGHGRQATSADAGVSTQTAQTPGPRLAAQDLAADGAAQDVAAADAAQSTDSTGDASTASLARAAEMLSQAPRHGAPVRNTIATPTHSPRWADDFSARVAMMVRGAESTASLQLTPVDLGPVEVSVTVRDSQASIHFGAAQADTRALLEASIPRLREMLAAQGFNLMDASVSQGFTRQSRSDVPPPPRLDASVEAEEQVTTRVTAVGLLDTYA